MKFPKNNKLEDWLRGFEKEKPWKAFKIKCRVKIQAFFINLKYKMSVKSPCCNVPMGNKECHETFAEIPIYECKKCKKKWV